MRSPMYLLILCGLALVAIGIVIGLELAEGWLYGWSPDWVALNAIATFSVVLVALVVPHLELGRRRRVVRARVLDQLNEVKQHFKNQLHFQEIEPGESALSPGDREARAIDLLTTLGLQLDVLTTVEMMSVLKVSELARAIVVRELHPLYQRKDYAKAIAAIDEAVQIIHEANRVPWIGCWMRRRN